MNAKQVGSAPAPSFDAWDDFDPVEYVSRNYAKILPEDQMIIETVVAYLKTVPLKNMRRVADVGAGPNFYPAMLLAPLVDPNGQIELIEFSKPNRAFMNTLLMTLAGYITTRISWVKPSRLIRVNLGNDLKN